MVLNFSPLITGPTWSSPYLRPHLGVPLMGFSASRLLSMPVTAWPRRFLAIFFESIELISKSP